MNISLLIKVIKKTKKKFKRCIRGGPPCFQPLVQRAVTKSISFIKKIKAIASNESTNAAVLKGIEDYESKKVTPTPLNLAELKAMINA